MHGFFAARVRKAYDVVQCWNRTMWNTNHSPHMLCALYQFFNDMIEQEEAIPISSSVYSPCMLCFYSV